MSTIRHPISKFYANNEIMNNDIIPTSRFICGWISIIYRCSIKPEDIPVHNITPQTYKNYLGRLKVYRRILDNEIISEACIFCFENRIHSGYSTVTFDEREQFKRDIKQNELEIKQEKWRSAFIKSIKHYIAIEAKKCLEDYTDLCDDVIGEIILMI